MEPCTDISYGLAIYIAIGMFGAYIIGRIEKKGIGL